MLCEFNTLLRLCPTAVLVALTASRVVSVETFERTWMSPCVAGWHGSQFRLANLTWVAHTDGRGVFIFYGNVTEEVCFSKNWLGNTWGPACSFSDVYLYGENGLRAHSGPLNPFCSASFSFIPFYFLLLKPFTRSPTNQTSISHSFLLPCLHFYPGASSFKWELSYRCLGDSFHL